MKQIQETTMAKIKKIYFIVLIVFFTGYFSISVILPSPVCAIISGLCVFALIWGIRFFNLKHSLTDNKWVPYILYLITFLTRFVYCYIMLPFITQVSDFKIVIDEAYSGLYTDCLDYYRFYFHKFLYPYLLHSFSLNTQTKIIIFQCFLVSLVPVLLFLIGKKIGRTDVGIISAVIYIIWPSILVYTQLTSEEHISAVTTPLIIYLFICAQQRIEKMDKWNKSVIIIFLDSIIIGVLCCISSFSKDWALIIMVATVICSLYQILKGKLHHFIIMALSCAIILIGRSTVNNAITSIGQDIFGITPNNGVISQHMYETLDPNSDGRYNVKLNNEYQAIVAENDYDFDRANAIAMSIVKERIAKDYKKMPKLLITKAQDAYCANEELILFALDKEVKEEYKSDFHPLTVILIKLDHVYYVFLALLLMLSVFINRNRYIYYIQLIILGCSFVSIIVESQQRYKYSMLSLWCIPIAYAIAWIYDKRKQQKKNSD